MKNYRLGIIEALEELKTLDEADEQNENPKNESIAPKCIHCKSSNVTFINSDASRDPCDTDEGDRGMSTTETNYYRCNDCSAEFYTFVQTVVINGVGYSKKPVQESDGTMEIIAESGAGLFVEVDNFRGNVDEYTQAEIDELIEDGESTESDIVKEFVKSAVNGKFYPRDEIGGYDDVDSLIELSEKLNEYNIDLYIPATNYGNRREGCELSGKQDDLKRLINYCKSEGISPFYDSPEDWGWVTEDYEFTPYSIYKDE